MTTFREAALEYLDAGLYEAGATILPLPPRKKSPPPVGLTGEGAERPDVETQAALVRKASDDANIALRLPRTVIGIDVDPRHGGHLTLARLIEKLGVLPTTFRSTARHDDPAGGVRLFTVPADVVIDEGRIRSEFGPGIEIIRYGHRYMVVWPSVHPDTGGQYGWYGLDGALMDAVPSPADVPALPDAWIAALRMDDDEAARRSATTAPVEDLEPYFDKVTATVRKPEKFLAHRVERFEKNCAERRVDFATGEVTDESVYLTGRHACLTGVVEAYAGLFNLRDLHDQLLDAYAAARVPVLEGRGDSDAMGTATGEFRRMFDGAVAKVDSGRYDDRVAKVRERIAAGGSHGHDDDDIDEDDLAGYQEWAEARGYVRASTNNGDNAESERLMRAKFADDEAPELEPEREPAATASVKPPPRVKAPGEGRLVLPDAAVYGPHGDLALALAPYTEADPAAILATSIGYHGGWIGRRAWVEIGQDRLFPNISPVIVGETALARKGTSRKAVLPAWRPVLAACARLVPPPLREADGFTSGVALIDGMSLGGTVVWFEEETPAFLAAVSRQGSDLGQQFRKAMDGIRMENRTVKRGHVVAEEGSYSLTFMGHVTLEELRMTLSSADVYGGTANRLVWVWANNPERWLAVGSTPSADPSVYDRYRMALGLDDISSRPVFGPVPLSTEAAEYWAVRYPAEMERLSGEKGVFGAVMARSAANTLRVATVYADSMRRRPLEIRLTDLEAAVGFIEYCEWSSWKVFGAKSGNARVDRLVMEIAASIADPHDADFILSGDIKAEYGGSYMSIVNDALSSGLVEEVRLREKDADGVPKKGRPKKAYTLTPYARSRMGLEF